MVRLIYANGKQAGIVSISEALAIAEKESLDLIEIAPNSDPVVCKLMDYGKYRYQQTKKQHEVKKHQKTISIKEIRLRSKIEEHDFDFKLKNALRFLKEGHKVKISMLFRGRENIKKETGLAILERFRKEIGNWAIIEQSLKSEGSQASIIFGLNKVKLKDDKKET